MDIKRPFLTDLPFINVLVGGGFPYQEFHCVDDEMQSAGKVGLMDITGRRQIYTGESMLRRCGCGSVYNRCSSLIFKF